MESREFVYDAVLWLSMLSIVIVCLVLLYTGVNGIAHIPDSQASLTQQAFSVSVYILFIILPLLMLDLLVCTTFISKIIEWSVSLIYLAIVADIILMTVFYLLLWPQ